MDRRERESLDRHITGNYGEDQFHDARELVKELLRNNEVLTRQEEYFNFCVENLSDAKRRAVYQYVATLKERIRLLTEAVEDLRRDATEAMESVEEAQRLVKEIRGELEAK